ncbi:hybrid sensor histidine kinase/response regulator [Parapedobacter lycopersici]|uniref:hybrid sensor histidine kinase/response regulator n=1 Tax=Parapedobacter lycopersici TaxID=1864939 RepID=UPI0033404914
MVDDVKILYVDDDLNNLIGFKASLRKLYKVYLAKSVAHAREILTKHDDIRIVFSDQHMPETSGIAFFELLREIYPQAVRILVTGYASKLSVVEDAINRGNVFRYMKKPWKTDTLLRIIAEANQFYLASWLLAEKNKELEKAYTELDKFAHSVSHDIRGPLAGIMSATQLAKDIDDEAEIDAILTIIGHSAERLDRYIQNVHDYYSVRRGEFLIVDIDFNTLRQELIDMYDATVSSKNIRFTVDIDETGSFRNDETAIKLILTNLISNAFKYQRADAAERMVNVSMSVQKGTAVFVVKDNGIGIQEHYLKDIFNLFFRASLQEPGSGLGLYNVKSLLSKLGGDITVESTHLVGSTFTVFLPTK